MQRDLAGKAYWSNIWTRPGAKQPIDSAQTGWRSRRVAATVDFFHTHLKGPPGRKLVEVGAGASQWLPYFAKEMSFDVTGIDYSPEGCELARRNLRSAGVKGEILEADLFEVPSSYWEKFDVVISLGVVEHFEDGAGCLQAIARLAKNTGTIITAVPNLRGLVGLAHRIVNPGPLACHVLLDKADLERIHREAGLTVRDCRYSGALNFAVVNNQGASRVGNWLYEFLKRGSVPFLILDDYGLLPINRWTSNYIRCAAIK